MSDRRGPFFDRPPVALQSVIDATMAAFAATKESRKLAFPDDVSMETLWSECFSQQVNFRNNARRNALAAATRALSASLTASKESVETIAWLRDDLAHERVGNDPKDDFGLREKGWDNHSLGYFLELQEQLHAMADAIEALRNSPVLELSYPGSVRSWKDMAPRLADAFLRAIQNVSPGAGRLNLPPRFVAAIVPHLTGEEPTPGTVKERLASSKYIQAGESPGRPKKTR